MQEDRRVPRRHHQRRPGVPRRRAHRLHARARTAGEPRPVHHAGGHPFRHGAGTMTSTTTAAPEAAAAEPMYRILLIEDDEGDALIVEELL
ncbi:fused response regulator/phosphatase, partial [Streptomyces sp. NPDC057757]